MESLLALLFLGSLILLIIGFFNPKTSLFWDKNERTKKKSRLVYGGLTILFFILFGAVSDKTTKNTNQNFIDNVESEAAPNYTEPKVVQPDPVSDSLTQVREAIAQKEVIEEAEVLEKLKARAKRDWPNDYSTQEFWINEEIEDYRYMRTIPNDAIKRQAQRDWPLDFSTQKFWYNEQIEAKERLGN
jgi:hypothetical protein